MQLGVVGLGRMGGNIVRRLDRAGHTCVGFDINPEAGASLVSQGHAVAGTLEDMIAALTPPRAVWLMVPAGGPTQSMVERCAALLEPGDTLIDGGNSFFQDDVARAASLKARGIDFLDVGTSGGVAGLERGYCLMIGGDADAVRRLDPVFAAMAPGLGDIPRTLGIATPPSTAERGYLHCGPAGAGHFVKMIHNGIEYGMMQSFAEGFDIMRGVAQTHIPENRRYNLDLAAISELWRRGSVVTSWLLDLTAEALARDNTLSGYSGIVNDSGEGRWTIQAAIEEAVPAEALTAALYTRFRSRQDHTFAEKVLSAMRAGFGGHAEPIKRPI